jgi:hypothetical protein
LDIEGPLVYRFAAIAGGAEAAICDKPLWKHRRRWVYRVVGEAREE